jgi:hypothetical protein
MQRLGSNKNGRARKNMTKHFLSEREEGGDLGFLYSLQEMTETMAISFCIRISLIGTTSVAIDWMLNHERLARVNKQKPMR